MAKIADLINKSIIMQIVTERLFQEYSSMGISLKDKGQSEKVKNKSFESLYITLSYETF